MKIRRLLGGFVVAMVIAFVLSATAHAVYIDCSYFPYCWPF